MHSKPLQAAVRKLLFAAAAGMVLSSCAAVSASKTSRLHPPEASEAGAHRVAEVRALATREEILDLGAHYRFLVDSGIEPAELKDGSLAVGQTYCCGGPSDQSMAMWIYVPAGPAPKVGDIVEVRMGRQPEGEDPGAVNVLMRIREKEDCRWEPQNPKLWMRVLYCDWMEDEGWVEKTGFFKTWLKPSP